MEKIEQGSGLRIDRSKENTITVVKPTASINRMLTKEEFEALRKRVNSKLGYAKIIDLSGELEEGLYLCIFNDDGRYLFEDNDGKVTLLLTQEQGEVFIGLSEEEQLEILEEVLCFYHIHKTEGEILRKNIFGDD